MSFFYPYVIIRALIALWREYVCKGYITFAYIYIDISISIYIHELSKPFHG